MSGTNLAVVPAVTSDELELVKQTVANGATGAELKLYLYDCQRQGVHPLDRLLHFTKRGGKYTPVTSIDFMRTRAADTGEYAGSDDAVFTGEPQKADYAATVTVWRMVQGQRCAFTATARWSEYKPDQNDFMWRKMPATMLAKCAEGLALRKGFPRQLAGLYASEELEQAENKAPTATTVRAVAVPPTRSGGDSDGRPSGAEALPDAALSGDSIIDTTTGEMRHAPPVGFYYVANYSYRNGWHEAHLLAYDAQGGALKVSTKRDFGILLGQAQEDGIPVKVTTNEKKNAVGEAYLASIETLKPEAPAAPMVSADQIHF